MGFPTARTMYSFGFFDVAMPENFGVPFRHCTANDAESKFNLYRSGPEIRMV
jgi:hypothetical protein